MASAMTGMTVNPGMKADLLSTAKWTKFLCIVGCIGVAIMLIAGLVMMVAGANFGLAGTPFGAGMGVFYLIIAALYIYPLIKGFQFANATKAACLTDNEAELARGFSGLRSLMQFFGILTIIVLVIYALILIGALVVAVAAS